MAAPEPLPRIACFHGGGSNSAIFSVQCESLQRLLSTKFEFIFFDAPFTRDAGPGVLPYFTEDQFGPYRTWFCKNGSEDGRDEEGKSESGIERVVRMIKEKGGEGEWVGCMGFSQGTRVVGGLLLEQMRLRQLGVPGLGVEFGDLGVTFRFGVLCMGGGAPMLSEISYPSNMDLVDIPTLHLHGLTDVNLENGRKQVANYYDPRTTRVIEINYHHAMPWHKHDLLKLEEAIRKIDKETEDMYELVPWKLEG